MKWRRIPWRRCKWSTEFRASGCEWAPVWISRGLLCTCCLVNNTSIRNRASRFKHQKRCQEPGLPNPKTLHQLTKPSVAVGSINLEASVTVCAPLLPSPRRPPTLCGCATPAVPNRCSRITTQNTLQVKFDCSSPSGIGRRIVESPSRFDTCLSASSCETTPVCLAAMIRYIHSVDLILSSSSSQQLR